MIHSLTTLLIAWMIISSSSISIDNDIIGDPDIECREDEIRVWVKTRKVFAGRIYAKGRSDLEECYKDDFSREKTRKPHFDLKFGACGMKSLRSVDPRGMYYGVTVVVSFHPLFITKVDQAFHVKCFFEEASKGLTAELGVSMIPTTELEARHGIPGCTYSIHSSSIDDLDAGRPAGQPILFARVGDRVLHQWHCNDQMYGVLINNCYVTDGFGKKADVIDDRGCPTDPILITGIRYSSDLQRAYAESSVFKFADKPGVWFFCQVQMCMKKHGMCQGITPPACGSISKTIGGGDDDDENSSDDNTSRQKASSHNNQPDYDYENSRRATSPPTRHTTISDYDYDAKAKLHSPKSSENYGTTAPADYEGTATESATPFAPPLLSSELQPTTTQESVSKTFETEDDLAGIDIDEPAPKGRKIEKGSSGDYNDYDEVTIPPNLSELLANLPDDISPDSIQKMLRDSVDNPKALIAEFKKMMKDSKIDERPQKRRPKARNGRELRGGDLRSGDKIDQIHVDWTSTRRRDDAIIDDSEQKPMLAGQLLIFDLDEEPPLENREKSPQKKAEDRLECDSAKSNLIAVCGSMAVLSACLLAAIIFLVVRIRNTKHDRCESRQTLRPDIPPRILPKDYF